MNLAVLFVDFSTYMFQGGNIHYYTQYESCDIEKLPFTAYHIPPMDFGRITFTYAPDGDTLMDGPVTWIARHDTDTQYVYPYYPTEIQPPDSFTYVQSSVPLSDSAEIYDYDID